MYNRQVTSRPRSRTLTAVLVVVVIAVVLSIGGYLLGSRGGSDTTSGGWRSARVPYSQFGQLSVDGGKGCLSATLSGVLRYERSTSGDKQFRNPVLVAPGMVVASRQNCQPGAAARPVDSARLTQTWTVSGGKPVGSRTATFGPGADWGQNNTGVSLSAKAGPSAKLCLDGLPTVALNGGSPNRMPKVQVCAT